MGKNCFIHYHSPVPRLGPCTWHWTEGGKKGEKEGEGEGERKRGKQEGRTEAATGKDYVPFYFTSWNTGPISTPPTHIHGYIQDFHVPQTDRTDQGSPTQIPQGPDTDSKRRKQDYIVKEGVVGIAVK